MTASPSEYSIDRLTDLLRADSDHPALMRVARGTVHTVLRRGELVQLVERMAAGLHARGIGEGDTIALAVLPGPRALAVVLAAIRLRIRVALVDPAVGPEVVIARLSVAEPRLVVTDFFAQAAAGPVAPLARHYGIHLPRLDTLAPVVTVGRRLPGLAPALDDRKTPTFDIPDRRGDNGDALIIFTSGTTESPRAVVHSVASVSAAIDAAATLVLPRRGDIVVGGTFFVMVPSLMNGAAVVRPGRSTRAIAACIEAARPDVSYLTPPQARDVLAARGTLAGRVFCGSSPVSANLLGRLRAAGAEEAWGVYAMTEAFPIAAVEADEKIRFARDSGVESVAGAGAPDLVGRTLPSMQAKADANGEIMVRGPGMADRYLGGAPFDWIRTGDRGTVEGDRILMAGRLKDMVLRGSENIYPGLYEPALHVDGVDVAVLVGIPDSDGDERLALMIQACPDVRRDEVRQRLRAAIDKMGSARPDFVVFADVPTSGRSKKPDRARASAVAADLFRRSARSVWSP